MSSLRLELVIKNIQYDLQGEQVYSESIPFQTPGFVSHLAQKCFPMKERIW